MRARASAVKVLWPKARAVELGEDECLDGFGCQARQHDRVSDAGTDSLVNGQGQGLEERRLADEHEIMRARKLLAEQAEFAEAVGGHEMGVINDGHEHLAGAVDAESFLDQQALASMVVPLELDLECLAKDAQDVVVSVERAAGAGTFLNGATS
jgi:hypothetical protein